MVEQILVEGGRRSQRRWRVVSSWCVEKERGRSSWQLIWVQYWYVQQPSCRSRRWGRDPIAITSVVATAIRLPRAMTSVDSLIHRDRAPMYYFSGLSTSSLIRITILVFVFGHDKYCGRM